MTVRKGEISIKCRSILRNPSLGQLTLENSFVPVNAGPRVSLIMLFHDQNGYHVKRQNNLLRKYFKLK